MMLDPGPIRALRDRVFLGFILGGSLLAGAILAVCGAA